MGFKSCLADIIDMHKLQARSLADAHAHQAFQTYISLAMYNALPTPSVYFLVYTTTYLMRLMHPTSIAVRCAILSFVKHQACLLAVALPMLFG